MLSFLRTVKSRRKPATQYDSVVVISKSSFPTTICVLSHKKVNFLIFCLHPPTMKVTTGITILASVFVFASGQG